MNGDKPTGEYTMVKQSERIDQLENGMTDISSKLELLMQSISKLSAEPTETPIVKEVPTAKPEPKEKKESTFQPRQWDSDKGDTIEPLANFPKVNDLVKKAFAQQYKEMNGKYQNYLVTGKGWRTTYDETAISPVSKADCQGCKLAYDELPVSKLKALKKALQFSETYLQTSRDRVYEKTTICNVVKGVYNKES